MPRVLLLSLLIALPLLSQTRARSVRSGVDVAPEVWLRAHAHAIASSEPASDDSDLTPLVDLTSNARVVGLGDATHGTHELFTLKQRILPLLVEHGFRTIAVEAGFGEWQAIRDYVRTGIGDPRTILPSHDYFFYDSEETLAIIEWARAWNAAGKAPIDIVAIDAAHPHAVIERVVSEVDASLASEVRSRYSCLDEFRDNPTSYGRSDPSFHASCRASVLSVRPLLESAHVSDDVVHEARVVEQGEESLSTNFLNRDAALAENIEWLAARGKVVVWAHDEHLGKTPYTIYGPLRISAGSLLAHDLGDGYVAIASTLLRGTFNAFGNGIVIDWPLDLAASDDVASLFARAGMPRFFIDLRQPLPRWLASPLRVRTAGSSIFAPGHTMFDVYEELPERFDAIIYVETSTPTWLRHRPIG